MNIEQARFNMIEQQIRPWDVLDQDILDLLVVVKREVFVPAAYRSLAFFDTEIPLPCGEHMFTPNLEARRTGGDLLGPRLHDQIPRGECSADCSPSPHPPAARGLESDPASARRMGGCGDSDCFRCVAANVVPPDSPPSGYSRGNVLACVRA
jgi:hypothetical protein